MGEIHLYNFISGLKNIKDKKSKKLYIKFFSIMILCISITVIIQGLLNYYNATASLKKEVGLSNLGQIKQVSTVIDLVLEEIDRTAGQFVLDADIDDFAKYKTVTEYGKLARIASHIGYINFTNTVIHSIYIYFENTQRIASSIGGEIYNLDDFYDKYWLMGYKKLGFSYTMPTHRFQKNIGSSKITGDIISHLRSLPLTGKKTGAVIINIDEDILCEMLTKNIVRSSEKFIITTPEGDVILSSDKALLYTNIKNFGSFTSSTKANEGYFIDKIGSKEMLVAYTVSEKNGFKYYSYVPTKLVYESIYNIQVTVVGICIILIILGLIISFILSLRIYKPIGKLVDSIKLSLGGKVYSDNYDEVRFIGGTFNELFGNKAWLEQKITDSMPLLRENFFRMLISSNDIEDEEYTEKMKSFNIPFLYDYFQTVAIEISRSERNRKVKTTEGIVLINSYIRELIVKEFYGKYDIFTEESDMNCIGVIVNFTNPVIEDDIIHLMDICRNIVKKSKDYIDLTLFAGIGRFVSTQKDICVSYRSALEALKYKKVSADNRVIYIGDMKPDAQEKLDMMLDKEELLLKSIRLCETDGCIMIIHRITDGLKIQKASNEIVNMVFLRIIGSIEKSMTELGIAWEQIAGKKRNTNDLSEFNDLDEISVWLSSVCESAIQKIIEKRQKKYGDLIQKVKNFVEINFQKDISVDDSAEIVGLSNSYFSKLFKEETGQTFVEYVTRIRMEKAKELLDSTDLKINVISEKVGFNNQTYFITLFKNHFGITPNGYKHIKSWENS